MVVSDFFLYQKKEPTLKLRVARKLSFHFVNLQRRVVQLNSATKWRQLEPML
jgi:hypothetical protein